MYIIVFCRQQQIKEDGIVLQRELKRLGQQLGQISLLELQ